ncbi:MAG: hypothetical protein EBU42_02585 [Synechococcus sp.]|nr:hypothetical protein [Synechococcus sp.]
MVSGSPPVAESPLSHDEAAAIDALPWPLLERQRLRLLAHSLRSLQAAAGRSDGALPSESELEAWAVAQPQLQREPSFRQLLIEQLSAAGMRLKQIAEAQAPEQTPLSLSLEQLIRASTPPQSQAHQPTPPASPDDHPPND